MAYVKQTWENLPSTNTPITAERLNHMEDGIEGAYEQGGGSDINVYNELSSSTVDTYSCDYVNNIRKIATASVSSSITIANQEIIDFDTLNTTTNELTYDSTEKGIVIGEGISKVLVSANLCIRYTSNNNVTYGYLVTKNDTEILSARCYKATTNPISCSSAGVLVNVEEGDIIQMSMISTSGSPSLTTTTSLTVEVIN